LYRPPSLVTEPTIEEIRFYWNTRWLANLASRLDVYESNKDLSLTDHPTISQAA
jgi:hypothetical protein